jgi:hypothetical protein
MQDLGFTRSSPGEATPVENKKPEIQYPSLLLEDANVDKVTGGDLKVGDECEGEFRLRVKSIADDNMGKRIGFDVLKIDNFQPVDAGEDEGSEDSPDAENATEDAAPADGDKTMPKALRYS